MNLSFDDLQPMSGVDDLPWHKLVWELYEPIPFLSRLKYSARIAACPLSPIISAVLPGSEVLDFGCGAGMILNILVKMGATHSAIGCDLKESDLTLARQILAVLQAQMRKPELKIDYLKIDGLNDMPPGPFDVVLMIDVMHHVEVEEQRACFEAAAARVKPGGRLVYKDMVDRPIWRNLANRLSDIVSTQDIIHYVPLEELESWAPQCKLRAIRRLNFNKSVYGHELIVFEKTA